MLAAPRICCLDLDTFFVSVERLFDPSLVGKPVIVGGRPGSRGVVTACSYETRAYGVHSGMSLTEAAKRAPEGTVFLPVRHDTYGTYSKRVRELAERFSPVVQTASIDEMYIDFSGCERLYHRRSDFGDDGTVLRVVRELRAAIQDELGLPSSVGIATSRPIAKVACGLAKPAGVFLIPAGMEAEILAPLPVRKLPGIGPVAEARLEQRGLRTLGDVAATPIEDLRGIFGSWAEHVREGALGRGTSDLQRDQPAFREHDDAGDTVRSISNERTFHEDVRDPLTVRAQISFLCERVCWRARRRGVKARTVTLKLRTADFDTRTRSLTVQATHSEFEVLPILDELYARARIDDRPIRLLGVAFSNLIDQERQFDLFDDRRLLLDSVDAIRGKYGFDAVGRATTGLRRRFETRSSTNPSPSPQRHPASGKITESLDSSSKTSSR